MCCTLHGGSFGDHGGFRGVLVDKDWQGRGWRGVLGRKVLDGG